MKIAIVNLGQIVSGDWRDPLVSPRGGFFVLVSIGLFVLGFDMRSFIENVVQQGLWISSLPL
jgi:hypothetical protein